MRDAEWFLDVWCNCGFIDGVHLRRIHYRILGTPMPNGRPYENNVASWSMLKTAVAYARWLELIDPAAFVDRRNPGAVINAESRSDHERERVVLPDVELPDRAEVEVESELRPSTLGGHWSDPEIWTYGELPEVSVDATVPDRWEIDAPNVGGYDYRFSSDQPLVEVWAEKTIMDDVLDPLCRELGVNYVPAAGTQSITNAHLLVERSHAARRPVRVLYASDYDKQGRHMPVTVARHAEYMLAKLGPVGFRLTPIVLTAEQVRRYDLPPDPTREGAVELDALEALHPGELARIVRAEVARLRDPTLAERLDDVEQEARDVVDETWQETTGELAGELAELHDRAERLVDRYRQLGGMLNDRLQADVSDVTDRHRAMADILNGNVQAEIGEVLARYRRQAQTLNEHVVADIARATEGYERRRGRLAGRLRRELNALVRRCSSAEEALAALAADFDVELPERPGPVLDDDPVERWLFDSERDWLDQLGAYRRAAHGNGADQ